VRAAAGCTKAHHELAKLRAYAHAMRDEPRPDLRLTQLMAVEASLADARRALARAARIPSAFSAEVRSLLLVVADIDRRVMLEVTG
jgi:hypothetical protein